ncbi:hypothetical protein JTE90_014284 [Oedothorax gibbosus]|uniref:Uncharacterized protein n=1 Tax=Oedothorax gibbosus TaxID=931172 RepID=A0AAV6TS99_9ARAC|nr:hypothetical protein JTE90_014284 [Oedothorax gibbosus]
MLCPFFQKNIFTEFIHEFVTWWSNWCESKDPSDLVECDAAGKASAQLLELLTEAKVKVDAISSEAASSNVIANQNSDYLTTSVNGASDYLIMSL